MPTTLSEFESVWPRIVADIEGHVKAYKPPQQSLDWLVKVYKYIHQPASQCIRRSVSL